MPFKIRDNLTDKEKEQNGVWVTICPGARIKVGSTSSYRYLDALQRFSAPHKNQLRRGVLSAESAEDVTLKALAEILFDWEGILDDDDREIPFSKSAALDYMKRSREFSNLVVDAAGAAENFKLDTLEDSQKN